MNCTMLDYALKYAKLGYNVIPVKNTGKCKEPLCEHGAKDGTTDEYQIREWWTSHPQANIGLVATNMLVVDIDGQDGIQDFEEIKKVIPGIPEHCPTALTGGGGKHLIFKKPNRSVKARPRIEFNGKRCNIDLRSGYSYIVVEPSIHQSGNRYEWEIPLCAPDNLPEMPDAFFVQCSETNPQQVLQVPSTPASIEAIAQCRHYVDNIPGIDEKADKGNCHNKLLSAACTIFHDFGLNEDEGWGILVDFNARCTPPWSDKELRHKVERALSMGIDNQGRPRGWRFTEVVQDNSPLAVSINEYAARRWVRQRAIEGEINASVVGKRAKDIQPKQYDWLWKGHIPKNELVLIAGKGGTGKTTFVMYLCATVSNGGEVDEDGNCTGTWPDGVACDEGAVLYLYSEDSLEHTLVPRLISAKGNLDNVWFARYKLNDVGQSVHITLNDRDDLGEYIEYLYANYNKKVSLIVFDPLTAFMPGVDENRNGPVRDLLNRMPEFLEQYGCSAIGIMHNKKGLSATDSAADTISGASAYVNTARAVLQLYYDKNEGVRKVLPAKWNISKQPSGISFDIDERQIDLGNDVMSDPIGYAKIVSCDLGQDADEYHDEKIAEKVGLTVKGGGKKRLRCSEWIIGFIKMNDESGNKIVYKDIINAGKDAGYSECTLRKQFYLLKGERNLFTYLDGDNNYVTTNSEAKDVPNPRNNEHTDWLNERIKALDNLSF